jgi:phage terminase large subunit
VDITIVGWKPDAIERRIAESARGNCSTPPTFFSELAKTYWDIGGAGAKGDATAIWVTQNVGLEIRVLDYMEFVGQPLGFIVNELRLRGYEGIACTLPHDGVNANIVTGKRYEQHLQDAGFTNTTVVTNQGAGAAAMRIEAVRRILPQCFFNEAKCSGGLEALAATTMRNATRNAQSVSGQHTTGHHTAAMHLA